MAAASDCEKAIAESFIRKSAWWLKHYRRPVRAPKHAKRLYLSDHGWAVDFGGNSFLVGKAIEPCSADIHSSKGM